MATRPKLGSKLKNPPSNIYQSDVIKRKLRSVLHLSQPEAAEKLNISVRTLGRWFKSNTKEFQLTRWPRTKQDCQKITMSLGLSPISHDGADDDHQIVPAEPMIPHHQQQQQQPHHHHHGITPGKMFPQYHVDSEFVKRFQYSQARPQQPPRGVGPIFIKDARTLMKPEDYPDLFKDIAGDIYALLDLEGNFVALNSYGLRYLGINHEFDENHQVPCSLHIKTAVVATQFSMNQTLSFLREIYKICMTNTEFFYFQCSYDRQLKRFDVQRVHVRAYGQFLMFHLKYEKPLEECFPKILDSSMCINLIDLQKRDALIKARAPYVPNRSIESLYQQMTVPTAPQSCFENEARQQSQHNGLVGKCQLPTPFSLHQPNPSGQSSYGMPA